MRRRSPTRLSSGMGLGLCRAVTRLWIRLVMKTVLPERLRPVTASQTAEPPASPLRLLASRSDASAKIGGSQLRLTGDGIRSIRFRLAGASIRHVGLRGCGYQQQLEV